MLKNASIELSDISSTSTSLDPDTFQRLFAEPLFYKAAAVALIIVAANIFLKPIVRRRMDHNWERRHLRAEFKSIEALLERNVSSVTQMLELPYAPQRVHIRLMTIPEASSIFSLESLHKIVPGKLQRLKEFEIRLRNLNIQINEICNTNDIYDDENLALALLVYRQNAELVASDIDLEIDALSNPAFRLLRRFASFLFNPRFEFRRQKTNATQLTPDAYLRRPSKEIAWAKLRYPSREGGGDTPATPVPYNPLQTDVSSDVET